MQTSILRMGGTVDRISVLPAAQPHGQGRRRASALAQLVLAQAQTRDRGRQTQGALERAASAPLVAHRGEYANGSSASGLTAATCKARPAAASQDFGNGIQC